MKKILFIFHKPTNNPGPVRKILKQQGFELPSDAVKLASGEMFENQAFRYGDNAYGVQFHPEISKMVLEEWAATTDLETEQKLKLPGAQPWEEQIEKHLQYAPIVENWLERFFSLWLNQETM